MTKTKFGNIGAFEIILLFFTFKRIEFPFQVNVHIFENLLNAPKKILDLKSYPN